MPALSLTTAKAHLRVDSSDDDTLIGALIDAANAKLMPQDEVTGAVIGVPADFTAGQCAAVEEAARKAGLTKVGA